MARLHGIARVRAWWHSVAAVGGKYLSVGRTQPGRADIRISPQGGEHLVARLGVAKLKGGSAVVGDHFGNGSEMSDQLAAEGHHFINHETGASQQQSQGAGEHDHQRLFALQGAISKQIHKRCLLRSAMSNSLELI